MKWRKIKAQDLGLSANGVTVRASVTKSVSSRLLGSRPHLGCKLPESKASPRCQFLSPCVSGKTQQEVLPVGTRGKKGWSGQQAKLGHLLL